MGDPAGWWGWCGAATETIRRVRAMSGFIRDVPDSTPAVEKNTRVVSPWMIENEALEDLTALQMAGYGFQDWHLEERD